MKLVMLCHPYFVAAQSVPRFAQMLRVAFEMRGHEVEVWSPKDSFYKLMRGRRFAKWFGYIDQYLVFPHWIRKALRSTPENTLFVFCDQALGPWVPLVKNRPHVVHAHDLLALRSALGDIPENPTSYTGRVYQRYIRRGFRQAQHFISISKKTRDDLHSFGLVNPVTSEVVYNGLNFPFCALGHDESRRILEAAGLPVSKKGLLLHVGGGQWYKNQIGLIALYAEYASRESDPLPLWCISPEPNAHLTEALEKVRGNGQILFFQNLDNRTLQAAYSYASAFLFPSLAEGFGWPLIEAQACGCPVITTDESPMNEVGGDATSYLPRLTRNADIDSWASQGAATLKQVVSRTDVERIRYAERSMSWARSFDPDIAIEKYLSIYDQILRQWISYHPNYALNMKKQA